MGLSPFDHPVVEDMSSVNLDNTMSVATPDLNTAPPPQGGKDEGAFGEHLKRAGEATTPAGAASKGSGVTEVKTAKDTPKTPDVQKSAQAVASDKIRVTQRKPTVEEEAEGKENVQAVAAGADAGGEMPVELSDETDRLVAELAAAGAADGIELPVGLTEEVLTQTTEAMGEKSVDAGQEASSQKAKPKSAKAAAGGTKLDAKPIQGPTTPAPSDELTVDGDVQSINSQEIEQIVPEDSVGHRAMQKPDVDQTPAAAAAQVEAVENAEARRPAGVRRRVAEQAETPKVASAAAATELPAVKSESSLEANGREASDSQSAWRAAETLGREKVASAVNERGGADHPAGSNASKGSEMKGQGGEDSLAGPADRGRFVQRVASAFQAAGEHSGSIRIRLHPPELGALRVEITVRDGLLSARLETETQAARNVLLENLPALRERLVQHDIKIARFDVDYQGGATGGSPQGPTDERQPQDRPAPRSRRAAAAKAEVEATLPRRVVLPAGEGAQLNVLV